MRRAKPESGATSLARESAESRSATTAAEEVASAAKTWSLAVGIGMGAGAAGAIGDLPQKGPEQGRGVS